MQSDTKTRITAKATEMFLTYGIRSITMDEIAESLGISKRTLYENFSNKEDLLRESIEWHYNQLNSRRQEIIEKYQDDIIEAIHQHFRMIMLIINEMHPNYFNDMQKYYARLWDEHVKEKQQENFSYTKTLLERGQQQGVFRPQANMDILSKMIHVLMPLLTSSEFFPLQSFNRAELIKEVLVNFIRGLATREGIAIIDQKFDG